MAVNQTKPNSNKPNIFDTLFEIFEWLNTNITLSSTTTQRTGVQHLNMGNDMIYAWPEPQGHYR
jgi:hypothetical protein